MTEPVTPTPISPLPPAPLITDTPEVFDDKAFPFAASLSTLQNQTNAQSLQTNQNAISAAESAVSSNEAKVAATSQADAALAYRNAAQAASATAADKAAQADSAAGIASAAQSAAQSSAAAAAIDAQRAEDAAAGISDGPVTSVNGKTGVVSLVATDIAPAATPQEMLAGTETAYRSMSPALAAMVGRVFRDARTADVVLTSADKGKLIDITAGTFTQTFDAAATLGNGWWCYLRNSGAGDITLDPNASEQIDGLTSYVMYPGECRLVQCDGAALRSVVLNGFYKTFTASGAFVKPPGYNYYEGIAWSGGGSGSKQGTTVRRSGGGGGGSIPFLFPAASVSASESVTIAAGGAAISSAGDGNPGGATNFGALLSVYGGSGGVTETNTFARGGGKVPGTKQTSGTFSNVGHGLNGGIVDAEWGGAGAVAGSAGNSAIYGGASGGGLDPSDTGQAGGSSVFGGDGGAGVTSANGIDGSAPGGGGGATQSGAFSGAGARGEIRIWGIF